MKKQIKIDYILGDLVYQVDVVSGEHGAWLFVQLEGKTIWEQSGYEGNYEQALGDGKLFCLGDFVNKQGYNLILKEKIK
jgi:hypothetical protein